MIQERIRSLIETKLNDNTLNKDFTVGSYAYLEDKKRDYIYSINNGYKLIDTNYIPVMMEFTCEYQAIPSQINGFATIPLTFLLKAETQEDLESDLSVLDEFVSKIIANSETIADGSKTYNSVWNIMGLIPAGDTRPINGTYYTQIQTTVYVDFSDTNYYGNQYIYHLNGSQVMPTDRSLGRDNEEDLPHAKGSYESKGLNKSSAVTFTLEFYVNSTISAIVDLLDSETYNMNTVYQLSITTPTRAKTDYSVMIKGAQVSTDLGEKATISITFYKSILAYSV